jgi:hypothetical protein
MPAPDYLSPALHGEYDRLTAMLTTPARLRDAAVIAKALHEGYQRGRVDAIGELLTSAQVAETLGISKQRLSVLARTRGVGWPVGSERLFRPEDIDALTVRVNGRPRKFPG